MNKFYFTLLFTLVLNCAFAQESNLIDTSFNLDGVFIKGTKEQSPLAKLPVAYTSVSSTEIESKQINSIRDLSILSPSLYMPTYGSKVTSALYIRGIGSRMNESAVGLYIDNMPYLEQSTYDFDFLDISSIEILRGPQGTLYGRNAMGGIINVYTNSPLNKQGTSLDLSYGNANTINARLTHAKKINDKVGFSIGGGYRSTDGFFVNDYTHQLSEGVQSVSARFRLDWRITERLQMHYTLSGEYSQQKGYAYGRIDSTGKIHNVNYNDPSGYKRLLGNHGLNVLYTGRGYTMNSTTSYQYLLDEMRLDQDFSPIDKFTLRQNQLQRAVTQEITLKSQNENTYQWLFGAFAFYKNFNTEAPVKLQSAFIQEISENFPTRPSINFVQDSGLRTPAENISIPSKFKNPRYGFALFHQSTYNDFLVEGLSITAGLRLDYEKVRLAYHSTSRIHLHIAMPPVFEQWSSSPAGTLYEGQFSNEFIEVLPKIAFQYTSDNKKCKLYATIAKGYTAGGYNTNLFADLVQDKLMPLPPRYTEYKEVEDEATIRNRIYFKPEYNWNYEIGGQMQSLDKKTEMLISFFYIDTRDQQVALFVPSGYGRVMKNAARSQSSGVEFSTRHRIGNLSTQLSYGYTHASFRQYLDSINVMNADGTSHAQEVSYKGNYVPFAPQHTFMLSAEYGFLFLSKWIDKLTIGANYNGAGKIYFTAENSKIGSQSFYGLLNAHISVEKNRFKLGIWGKNLLNTDYKVFYFESLGNSFAQRGNPFQFGGRLSIRI
ncbi:MAG: TonB-dependent receptor [Bacteroidales bacterium]